MCASKICVELCCVLKRWGWGGRKRKTWIKRDLYPKGNVFETTSKVIQVKHPSLFSEASSTHFEIVTSHNFDVLTQNRKSKLKDAKSLSCVFVFGARDQQNYHWAIWRQWLILSRLQRRSPLQGCSKSFDLVRLNAGKHCWKTSESSKDDVVYHATVWHGFNANHRWIQKRFQDMRGEGEARQEEVEARRASYGHCSYSWSKAVSVCDSHVGSTYRAKSAAD